MSLITENPRGTCVLGGVNNVLTALHKVCPIYHSGPGCPMQNAAGEGGQAGLRVSPYISSVATPCSNMLEREVVFGGEKKLRDEIDGALEVIDADAYFVLTGCTAGIIGDDVKSVTESYRTRGLPVYPVVTPGFAGDFLLGYETAFAAFLEYIVEDNAGEHEANLVNLFGIVPYHDPAWQGTLESLSDLLKKLGLRVHSFFIDEQGIPEIKRSSRASLNIIVNPWLLKGAAEEYKKRFGVPSLRIAGIPIGATDTSEFLRQVAEKLSLDKALVDAVIASEERYVYHYFETVIGTLSWKQFGVVGDANNAIGLARFLANDYSFYPLFVIITEPMYRAEDKTRIQDRLAALEYVRAPDVFFLSDHYEIREKIKEYPELSLLVGSSLEQEVSLECGLQHLVATFPSSDRLFLNRTYAGYRGSLTLVEDLFNNL